jgi:hypothetical protein
VIKVKKEQSLEKHQRKTRRERLEELFYKNVIKKVEKCHIEKKAVKSVDDFLGNPVKDFEFKEFHPLNHEFLKSLDEKEIQKYMESCQRIVVEENLLKKRKIKIKGKDVEKKPIPDYVEKNSLHNMEKS